MYVTISVCIVKLIIFGMVYNSSPDILTAISIKILQILSYCWQSSSKSWLMFDINFQLTPSCYLILESFFLVHKQDPFVFYLSPKLVLFWRNKQYVYIWTCIPMISKMFGHQSFIWNQLKLNVLVLYLVLWK